MVKEWNSNTDEVGLNPLPVALRANIRQHSVLKGELEAQWVSSAGL